MQWFDDIQRQVTQLASNTATNVYDFYSSQVKDNVIKILPVPPQGNQTALQIEAGQTGNVAPIAPPASGMAPANNNTLQASQIQNIFAGVSPLLIGVAVVGAILIFTKKGRS